MLKRIPVDQVCLGMYVQELCGPWLDHPFWKTRFVIRDETDLAKLRGSKVRELWIDTSKGLAPPGEPAEPAIETAADPVPAEPAAPEPPEDPQPPRVELQAELPRAVALVNQARDTINSLFSEARMGRAVDVERCLPLVDEIASSAWRNPGAIVSLARLKTHDQYTYMHSVAVCALMVALARQLGMNEDETREAGMAGLLHDMGKAAMPLEVLNKPGSLTDAEYMVMKSHPEAGYAMLVEGGAAKEMTLDVVLHHHERPDGKGYPHGLSGSALTRAARMGAICDVYDAITSNRPYKNAWDPADSLAKMAQWKGQFDPLVFQAFVKSLGIYPVGSLVSLKSGRLAVIVDQGPGSLTMPIVKVFYSIKTRSPVRVELVDLSAPGCDDAIAAREPREKWNLPQLDTLWAGEDALRQTGYL